MANWIYHRGICFNLRRITWLYVMISTLPLSTVAGSNGIETSDMSWWDARMYCKDEYNSDLFIPEVDTSLENPFNLQHNIHYWIGAVETSQWRWTDNTPLFKHFGYTFSDEHVKTKDLPGNSVTECYNHCKAKPVIHYIGLSERACYCLILDNLTSILGEIINGNPCPGNSEENCGNNSVISVYKTEVNFSIRDNQHNCAYAGQYLNQLHIFTGDCSRVLYSFCYGNEQKSNYSRCNDGLCVSSHQASWHSSNQSCSLVKVTSVNKGNLLELIGLMDDRWVGLHRTVSKIWNNKTRVNGNFSTSTSRGQKCLALWYESKTGLTADWLPCTENHKAFCEQITTPPGTLSTREDLATTNTVSVTSPDVSTGVRRSSTRNKMNTVKENKYGIYIGVGLLILLSLLTLMILFRRQGKFCFQKEENISIGYRTARGNNTYDDIQTSVNASAVAESGNLMYRNEVIQIPKTIAEYDQVRNTTETKSDKLVNMSEAKGDFETIKPQRGGEDHSNCYHHLGVGNEDEYDIAISTPMSNVRDSTYTRLNAIKDGGQSTPGIYAN